MRSFICGKRLRYVVAVLILSLLFSVIGFGKTLKGELFTDASESATGSWRQIYLQGGSGGGYFISNEKIYIAGREGIEYGIYHVEPISGHFYVEAEFEKDDNVGLALIQSKDGRADIQNFTMLCVDTNEEGNVVVRVRDRQNGKDNVLDNTGKLAETNSRRRGRFSKADTYEHVLTGKQYSVPFDKTNKRIRIFRDGLAGFFHFYYSVKKEIRGEEADGWMELAPSRDWAEPGEKYFVALISTSKGGAAFTSLEVVKKPTADRDDRQTGFRAVRREYNWSGFFGDAVVVSFGDEYPNRQEDVKFVFWSEMNYVPAWHLNNQLLFTYEFVETWGGGNPGCHEPMSDRLLRWSQVKILEDNDVRKVVHWHYVLCNPDYKVPDNEKGEQVPEVDEYWTFYPDGTGVRYIEYRPKLDTDFRASNELAELIGIAGSLSDTEDFFASPALTMLNLEGGLQAAHPGVKFDFGSELDDWKQMILATHFKNLPDVFYVFSMDSEIPETFSGYNVGYQNTWHNANQRLVHWPVGKRPYTGNNGSGGSWKGEVAHSCLISCDVQDGIEWEDHFKTDEDGRKYRDWSCLVGTNSKGDFAGLRNKTKSWLWPGEVNMSDDNCRFLKIDYKKKSLVFVNTGTQRRCCFNINPKAEDSVLINPAICIRQWGVAEVNQIVINDKEVPRDKYRVHYTNGDVLLWINTRIDDSSNFRIE